MQHINADKMTTEALEAYDDMMLECALKVQNFAALASLIWTDVLKELDRRGRVKIVSGSYEEPGSSIINRTR